MKSTSARRQLFYHQEAAYTENEEKYFELLERAYFSYKEAIEPLKKSEEWQSLAYTYYNLAETSEWYGDLDEAVSWIKRAIEMDKKYGFTKDLEEDVQYLSKLESIQTEMLNKQRNADSVADAPSPDVKFPKEESLSN